MSLFDPDTFLDQEVEGANSTVTIPIPANVYPGVITDVSAAHGTSNKPGKESKEWARLDVTYELEDPDLPALIKRDKAVVRQGIMLDVNELGGIDTAEGKNVQLGKLRKAAGLNDGSFRPRDLIGHRVLVSVTQRVNPNDADSILNDVKGVAALG